MEDITPEEITSMDPEIIADDAKGSKTMDAIAIFFVCLFLVVIVYSLSNSDKFDLPGISSDKKHSELPRQTQWEDRDGMLVRVVTADNDGHIPVADNRYKWTSITYGDGIGTFKTDVQGLVHFGNGLKPKLTGAPSYLDVSMESGSIQIYLHN